MSSGTFSTTWPQPPALMTAYTAITMDVPTMKTPKKKSDHATEVSPPGRTNSRLMIAMAMMSGVNGMPVTSLKRFAKATNWVASHPKGTRITAIATMDRSALFCPYSRVKTSGIVENRPFRSQLANIAMMSMPTMTKSSYQKTDRPHA